MLQIKGRWNKHVDGEVHPYTRPWHRDQYLCRCVPLKGPEELKVLRPLISREGVVQWVDGEQSLSDGEVVTAWFETASPTYDQATCALLLQDGRVIEDAVFNFKDLSWSFPSKDPNVVGTLKVHHRWVLMYNGNLDSLRAMMARHIDE